MLIFTHFVTMWVCVLWQIWDMRTKACVHTLAGHTNTVAEVRCQAAEPQVRTAGSRVLHCSTGWVLKSFTHGVIVNVISTLTCNNVNPKISFIYFVLLMTRDKKVLSFIYYCFICYFGSSGMALETGCLSLLFVI